MSPSERRGTIAFVACYAAGVLVGTAAALVHNDHVGTALVAAVVAALLVIAALTWAIKETSR